MTTSDGAFIDRSGRRLLLHGINLSGDSKLPVQPTSDRRIERFYRHREVSFVDRPFPIGEAGEHFARLRRWGFELIRLLVTWEGVEHGGPARYDLGYLAYLDELIARAGEHGLLVVVDFHQDAWSRFCGGSGAPGWTLEAAGMDIRRIDETGAAITEQAHVLPYEAMIWATNPFKLAAATMFSLFFAGRELAPKRRVDGSPIQDFLQARYLEALRTVATALRRRPNLLGYDPMNEPHPGYIGCEDLEAPPGEPRIGAAPTPLQSMALGEGIPQEVGVWSFGSTGSRARGTITLNPAGVRLWRDGGCPWREHGVWELDAAGRPRRELPDYFRMVRGRPLDFQGDCYRPFLEACGRVVGSSHPDAMLFVEPAIGVGHVAPSLDGTALLVSAPHWYDGSVLMLKRYSALLGVDSIRRRVVLGPGRIRRSYRRQIGLLARTALDRLSGAPTLIGEVGVPFDLRGRKGAGDDRAASAAMDRSLRAMEDARVSYAIWNYTPDNSGEHGDGWNGEDLSIYSRECGGRALRAVVRPHARACAGRILHVGFDLRSRRFELEVEGDPALSVPTEIFLPMLQYPTGFVVELSDGRWEHRKDEELLLVHRGDAQCQRIRILPARAS